MDRPERASRIADLIGDADAGNVAYVSVNADGTGICLDGWFDVAKLAEIIRPELL